MRALTTILLILGFTFIEAVAQSPPLSPAGAALTTIFSPTKAPARKTMGLLQRSFLDIAGQGDAELEVAIVVDGTESMSTELAGVRSSIQQMVADLKRYRNNEVRVAMVVYRDEGSPSGGCVTPLARFTSNSDELNAAVDSLNPESGAPFFHELADVGVHTAITQLPWTGDPRVQRWVLMFGDAPPYAEGFDDPKHPTARRRYGTELLVALAARHNIRINCVLCTSSENVVQPYDQAIDETRSFMNALASGTDGLMLDLSYPEIRTAMIDAGKQPTATFAEIEPITGIDIVAARRIDAPQPKFQPVSLAFLPHSPFLNMSFDPNNDAVQVSTAMRHRFSQLPGVRVASPLDIERQLRRLRSEGVNPDQLVRALASRLGVDYVVWGSVEPNTPRVQTAAYRRRDGERVVQVTFDGDRGRLANVLLTAAQPLASNETDSDAFASLAQRVKSLSMDESMDQPISRDPATSREILAAMEALQQSLAYVSGDEASVSLLERADASCRAALVSEPRHPLAHWLAANVAYNQALRLYKLGEIDAAEKRMSESKSSLRRAIRQLQDVDSENLAVEIEADFALLVQRDLGAAISKYTEMTSETSPSSSQCRGHWMLAGIYAGDWSVDEAYVDPKLARENVIQILANWPDSPESTLLKQWLRWDDESEQTEFNYLPRMNVQLSEAPPAEATEV